MTGLTPAQEREQTIGALVGWFENELTFDAFRDATDDTLAESLFEAVVAPLVADNARLRATVERVEALCLRMEQLECLCHKGANQYGAFFVPQPECPSHGHHSALFRAAIAGGES